MSWVTDTFYPGANAQEKKRRELAAQLLQALLSQSTMFNDVPSDRVDATPQLMEAYKTATGGASWPTREVTPRFAGQTPVPTGPAGAASAQNFDLNMPSVLEPVTAKTTIQQELEKIQRDAVNAIRGKEAGAEAAGVTPGTWQWNDFLDVPLTDRQFLDKSTLEGTGEGQSTIAKGLAMAGQIRKNMPGVYSDQDLNQVVTGRLPREEQRRRRGEDLDQDYSASIVGRVQNELGPESTVTQALEAITTAKSDEDSAEKTMRRLKGWIALKKAASKSDMAMIAEEIRILRGEDPKSLAGKTNEAIVSMADEMIQLYTDKLQRSMGYQPAAPGTSAVQTPGNSSIDPKGIFGN